MATKEISEVRDRAAAAAEILDALPDIMRRLIESHPITGGELELTLAQVRALGVLPCSSYPSWKKYLTTQ